MKLLYVSGGLESLHRAHIRVEGQPATLCGLSIAGALSQIHAEDRTRYQVCRTCAKVKRAAEEQLQEWREPALEPLVMEGVR